MSMRWILFVIGLAALPATQAAAQERVFRQVGHHPCPQVIIQPAPGCATPQLPPTVPPTQPPTQPPDQQPQQPLEQPDVTQPSSLAAAGETGTGAAGQFDPQMIGDLGVGGYSTVRIGSAIISAPLITRGPFKISENESPRPGTRVFFNYNWFVDARSPALSGNGTGNGGSRFDVHRMAGGGEFAFLDSNASVGIRAPFSIQDGRFINTDDFGDVSLIGKYAFINDRDTGDVFSGGMVVTLPTGPTTFILNGEEVHNTLLQPFVGYILNVSTDVFLQGFSSVVIPLGPSEPTLWVNDIAVGYRMYQNQDGDGAITYLIPTVEAHATNPLNYRGRKDVIGFPDLLAITAGVHVGLFDNFQVTIGGSVPVTGPKPYAGEAIVQGNLRF